MGRAIGHVGLAVFLVGFASFVASVGLGEYEITPRTFERLSAGGAIREDHREALYAELAPLVNRRYGSVFEFLSDVDGKIDLANGRLGEGQIWDYDRGQYKFWIAREAGSGPVARRTTTFFVLGLVVSCLGALVHFGARTLVEPPGIKNNGVFASSAKARGLLGIAIGTFLIGFYVALYFYPATLTNWIRLGDPVSLWLRGRPADRWFFYGLLYTLTILVMGVRMMVNYRHSPYHLVRTASVMFFQFGFAFLIPAILAALNKPEVDFKNAWPLDYSFFYSYRMDGYTSGAALGWFLLLWGLLLALILVPLLAWFFGKRWYCSWVCGCGGLAETLGDPFRQLSDRSLRAWRIERWSVHAVLVFAVVLTGVVLVNWFSGRDGDPLFGELTTRLQSWYGFLIGSIFAGVVGTGFYPLMGNRVWCRFGCPLAAILGLVQRFHSRFRITSNGGQCISCGNCSTYCEMGIDVRWYAQRGQNVVRASCVGCGVCAAVCPRGVLRLENGPVTGRLDEGHLLQVE